MHLSFQLLFSSLVARGRSAFAEFHGAAEAVGLLVPLRMVGTVLRVVPCVLYGIEFRIALSNAESSLNRLQVSWAKHILGFPESRAGSLLVCECGWRMRLGTLMLRRALMLKARISLLPTAHPAPRLFQLADDSDQWNWATHICAI